MAEPVLVYCFVDANTPTGSSNEFMRDVLAVAVCGECHEVITSHVSSNEDWAGYDIMRPWHVQRCQQHANERHGAAEAHMAWFDTPRWE